MHQPLTKLTAWSRKTTLVTVAFHYATVSLIRRTFLAIASPAPCTHHQRMIRLCQENVRPRFQSDGVAIHVSTPGSSSPRGNNVVAHVAVESTNQQPLRVNLWIFFSFPHLQRWAGPQRTSSHNTLHATLTRRSHNFTRPVTQSAA